MEKHYTKEQIKQLEELGVVPSFLTATVSDFKRGTLRKQDEAVADIYEKAAGISVNRNFGCSVCNYRLYKQAGELYYKSVDYYKKLDAERMAKARAAKGNKQPEEPAVHMKDGIITINIDKALEEENNVKTNIK